MPNYNWGVGTVSSSALVPDSLTNVSVAAPQNKLTEVANNLNWAPVPAGGGTSNLMPTDFTALTNGQFNNGMTKSLNAYGDKIASSFSGLSNIGATDIAGVLLGQGAQSGGISKLGVKLVSKVTGDLIFFDVMPSIAENRSVSYDEIIIAHHPGTIVKYNHTAARGWSISNIKLVSRTIAEADANQKTLNLLRSWMMPYYGYGTELSDPTKLGAPPEVLTFSAYGEQNIGEILVVVESANWDWANDIDYIHTSNNEPFPVLMTISITLKEAWSPRQYSGFSLQDYKAGNLSGAYDQNNIGKKMKIGNGEPPELLKRPDASVSGSKVNTSEATIVDPHAAENAAYHASHSRYVKGIE
jgi:hypothetical protein